MSYSIYIAYGSETGNAESLANDLYCRLENLYSPTLVELDDLVPSDLTPNDVLIIITSSFGDGEAPGNATLFYDQLCQTDNNDIKCQFAVFGLGDVSYPRFCGFSIEVDALMRQRGANAIAERVDADTSYQLFFDRWSAALSAYFASDPTALQSLNLQVKSYGETQAYRARIESVQRLDSGNFPVYDIRIDIAGSGMFYQAGDLLYVLPPPNQSTLSRLRDFYGHLSDQQLTALGKKELRQLSKPLFRALAKHTGSRELKALTKMSAAKKLADYLYGRDIADVLQDFCTPEALGVDDLVELLSNALPRAYSIASCGRENPDDIRLCVREVNYSKDGKNYVGSASHFLAQGKTGTAVDVYVRSNPHFHLPTDTNIPVIMIGAGTGIAPYLGFLDSERRGEAHLFFGERHYHSDFLYEEILRDHLDSGRLTALYTAFSRDQDEKIYVQDVLRDNGEKVWQLLKQNGEIYVCGSKANLAKVIDDTLQAMAQIHGGLGETEAKNWLYELVVTKRYHRDLY
ncbi:MAG: sulfite reductase [Gammaproteobacteria bacterium]|nr:MAG: sulfite reductase [Gammaproteobacteria bacterium]